MKIEKLKNEAVKAIELRGHKLGKWIPEIGSGSVSSNACSKCGKEVTVDTAPPPNGIEIGGEALALNCIGIEPDRVEELLDVTGLYVEGETKKEQLERLLREETPITEYAESIGIEPENLAALVDQELERFNAQVEAEIRKLKPDKSEPDYSVDLIAEQWDDTPKISIHDFKSRFLTDEQAEHFQEDVLDKQSPHWNHFEMKFSTGELFEMAGLIPFKVKYSETRSYSLMVSATDEDEARELADAKIYESKNQSAWSFSDEEYDVTDTRLSYEVVVGNIGTTYEGKSFKEAWKNFDDYVDLSKVSPGGRASGEDVSLFRDGDLFREFSGSLQESV